EFLTPGKITVSPALDLHTGFPYAVQNEQREFVGPRDAQRFPTFASVDMQVSKEIRLPVIGKKAKVGVSAFNILNHYNPRDVQTIAESDRFGGYYNTVGRTFRGKFVLDF